MLATGKIFEMIVIKGFLCTNVILRRPARQLFPGKSLAVNNSERADILV